MVTVFPMITAPAARSIAITVASRDGVPRVEHGTVLGGHVGSVENVLDADGNAVQRPDGCPETHSSAARACVSA